MIKFVFTTTALFFSLLISAQDFMLQGWYWDYPSSACTNGVSEKWAPVLQSKVSTLADAGFSYIWLPPSSKGGGECSVGYDPKDLYDLGSYGSTRLGSRSQFNSLMTAINSSGMKAVADVVYNHRDAGDYEDNPPVRDYIMNYSIPTAGCNNGITPYPVNGKARWRLPLGGSSGNTAGDYYLKMQSASQNNGFYHRRYRIRFETSIVGYQAGDDPDEVEPNGGLSCGTPTANTTVTLGKSIPARIDDVGAGECGIDEFYLALTGTDYNDAGDFLDIYIEEIDGNGTGIDIKPIELYAVPRNADVLSELSMQTRTNFFSMPSGLGGMNYTNFKPNGTDPTCLEGDWDFPYFFFDVDQRTASTQTVYNEWTEWLLSPAVTDNSGAGYTGGLRMDAVKHFDPSMVTNLLNYLSNQGINPEMVVGEIFDTGTGALNGWVNSVQSGLTANVDVRAFDFNLRQALKDACDQHYFNFNYDVRNVFNAGMVAAGSSGFNVVTFVNNHDYRDENQPVQDDPLLAYAYILTNNKVGLPCVFYPDFFGDQPPHYPATNIQAEITALMEAHSDYIFGASLHDYLNAFGTSYTSFYNSGSADKCLIYQIRGGGSGSENVVVAINFGEDPLQVDHTINTFETPVGSQFDDVLGNSAFPFAVVSANSPNGVPNSIYIDLPPRSYSIWVKSSILPAELVDFNVIKIGENANLSWETVKEDQVAHFAIERSIDGRTFNPIGQLKALGNTAEGAVYNFIDDSVPVATEVYYRLRIVDVDRSEAYSPLRQISSKEEQYQLWPNPVKDQLNFSFTAIAKQCRVYNANGLLLTTHQLNADSDAISTKDWLQGMYTLIFELEDGQEKVIRIVK